MIAAGWLTDKVGEEGGIVEDALEAGVQIADDQRVNHVPRPVLELNGFLVRQLHSSFHVVHSPNAVLVDCQAPERAVGPAMCAHHRSLNFLMGEERSKKERPLIPLRRTTRSDLTILVFTGVSEIDVPKVISPWKDKTTRASTEDGDLDLAQRPKNMMCRPAGGH